MDRDDPPSAASHSPGTPGRSIAPVIAIDGPVASGKTAVGLALARELGYRLVDTGMMYRAVTWLALQRGVDVQDDDALVKLAGAMRIELGQPTASGAATIKVEGQDITSMLRSPEIDRSVSVVSQVPGVRTAMVRRQREFAKEGRLIMLGRDIGTVVLTDAPLKIYLDASPRERAKRRYLEMAAGGSTRPEAEVMAELLQRDEMDRQRAHSPLRPADDAVIIETDNLTLEQVVAKVRTAAGG